MSIAVEHMVISTCTTFRSQDPNRIVQYLILAGTTYSMLKEIWLLPLASHRNFEKVTTIHNSVVVGALIVIHSEERLGV